MNMLVGSWRRDENGEFKVFVSGKEEAIGSKVEIIPRYGEVKYTVITGTNSKFKGGYLYDYKFTSKSKGDIKSVDTMFGPDITLNNLGAVVSKIVSIEDLDAALGLD